MKSKFLTLVLLSASTSLLLAACGSKQPKPPPEPKTQTAKSAKTGAVWGGIAGLVFGGSVSDAVTGAIVGGGAGAAYGSVKANEQLKKQENQLAYQQVRLEQERNFILQKEIAAKQANPSYVPEPTEELLVRAFGQDNVNSLNALTRCDHRNATLYAMAGANSDFLSHRLASIYLEAMIAEDKGDANAATAAYEQIVVQDASVATADRARMETLDALADVRAERRLQGISCPA